jgi:hypothetical protein
MGVASGYGGRVLIDGKICKANKWSVDFNLETEDMTSTQGSQVSLARANAGVDVLGRINTKWYLAKVADISVTIEAFYDDEEFISPDFVGPAATQRWLSSGHNLRPGKEVVLVLYPNKYSATMKTSYWWFTKFLILQCTQTAEAKGLVKLVISGKNNSPDYLISNI